MKDLASTVLVVALVGAVAGIGYLMYKKTKEPDQPLTGARMARAVGREGAYECYNFTTQCSAGDVGGCKQYEDTCRSAQAVRMTEADMPKAVAECAAFRDQCAGGDYTSCNLYMRGCQYEGSS